MRVYVLQIHNSGTDDLDDIVMCEDFKGLCSVYDKKFSYLKTCCEECIEDEYPSESDSDGVEGGFKFGNADGTLIIGKVYDYDVFE